MRSRRVLAMVLVAVLTVGIMPTGLGIAYATRSIDSHYPLQVAAGGQIQPQIEWPYVVFKDGRDDYLGINDGEPYIQVYNMETGRVFPTTPENLGRWEQSNPSISGDRVVYSDQRNYDDSDCDIYMYDISTGLESLVCTATNGQGNPFIDGDTIAWVDRRDEGNTSTDIYMKDLATGEESVVTTSTGSQYEPTVWENYVVWRDQSSWSSACMKDLESGETTVIAAGGTGGPNDYWYIYDPYIDDGVVVYSYQHQWYTGVWNYVRSIKAYDIETGETTTLSTVNDNTNRWHPETGDGWVTWTDRRSGQMEVWGYDLASEEETCLVAYDSDGDGSYAGRSAVGDGWVLWHDHRAGDGDDSEADLYGMSLDSFTSGMSPATQAMPLEGMDRYETAVDVCQQAFPDGADTLVVSTGKNWPDALAGASLAGAYNAPILLVSDMLPAAVADEIERLGPDQVFLLGGDQAVATPVEDDITSIVGTDTVVRLAGEDRYETACIVASETVSALGEEWDGTAFATTGNNWPDALAASPLAAHAGYPVFLADYDGFDAVTEQCMSDLGVTGAIVLGGTVAMPLSVMAQVESVGVTETVRVGGSNRYSTAALIADYGVSELGMSYDTVGISTGTKYPDALSAGAVLGEDGFVMLLTPGTYLHASTRAALEDNCEEISQVRFVGGLAALTSAVRDQIMDCVE